MTLVYKEQTGIKIPVLSKCHAFSECITFVTYNDETYNANMKTDANTQFQYCKSHPS